MTVTVARRGTILDVKILMRRIYRPRRVSRQFVISGSERNTFFPAYHIWYTGTVGKKLKPSVTPRAPSGALEKPGKRVPAVFYRTDAGGEPLRNWLKCLPFDEDRKRIGEDIKTVEFGWPIGMPVCRSLGDGVHEIRTSLAQNRIAGSFSISIEKAEWSCCMDSSRRRRKHLKKI